jgi:6-phosphogluconolactonase (cycloisomerase 2 family)
VSPSGKRVWIIDRGNNAQEGKQEDPGAIRSFHFDQGKLTAAEIAAPNQGYDFGPRHADFHPVQPWLYVSDERRNRLYMFRFSDDRIEPMPTYVRETLRHPAETGPRQLAGAIHVHPSGRFVYVANRADGTTDVAGEKVFAGGENNIAVFAIDPHTGEPTLIQHADTHAFHVRTFACDASGRLLVTASVRALALGDEQHVRLIPAALSSFRILDNGQLQFARQYEVETHAGQMQYWMGMVALGG